MFPGAIRDMKYNYHVIYRGDHRLGFTACGHSNRCGHDWRWHQPNGPISDISDG